MLGSLIKRSPLVLRVFLTAASALSAILLSSAFTFVRSPIASPARVTSPLRTMANTHKGNGASVSPARPSRVIVEQGDTLSKIAGGTCGTPADWTGFFVANRSILDNPNVIYPGQKLRVNCADPGYAAPTAPAQPQAALREQVPAQPQAAPHEQVPAHVASPATPALSSQAVAPATYSGASGMQACIIARESGGNSQVVNASGHYGLYQFSYSTWVGSGGNPADFGHASVAEQNQVFANAVAARGYSDWAPYDGCGA